LKYQLSSRKIELVDKLSQLVSGMLSDGIRVVDFMLPPEPGRLTLLTFSGREEQSKQRRSECRLGRWALASPGARRWLGRWTGEAALADEEGGTLAKEVAAITPIPVSSGTLERVSA
jgi:hypothetical protein